ncbi:phosphoribosylglycinamide formyltransferase, partial [Arcanobacterium haemolyticum]|nr:phosphoribosylglycinamide formyltransferase [Arcanobacterium haemolyticum]
EGDDEASLAERIKSVERAQLVESVGVMAREGWWVEGRRAGFGNP